MDEVHALRVTPRRVLSLHLLKLETALCKRYGQNSPRMV